MRIITTALFILLSLSLFAQVKYGQIEYLQSSEVVYEPEEEKRENRMRSGTRSFSH